MEAVNVERVAPVAQKDRVVSLDVLRGFALLGILILNIQSFSMIGAAYMNPTAYGDLEGVNRWVWALSHLFGDQKFMTIFSMLFGAGILLMSEHAIAKGKKATGLHYRRMIVLLLFGAGHAYLLWNGDVLALYGACGLIVYLLRNLSSKWLIVIGIISIAIPSAIMTLGGIALQGAPASAVQQIQPMWQPLPADATKELTAMRGGWFDQIAYRAENSMEYIIFAFLIWGVWRAGGLMLIGMVLYRWGVFSAARSNRTYATMALLGLAIGVPIIILGMVRNFEAGWSLQDSMLLGMQFNYWASIAVSLAYIGIVMLVCKTDALRKLTVPFAAVGRMALTNYLMQTIICTTLFYGHGLGWFGHLERIEQAGVVVSVWIFQLIVSPIWLKYFRFGPFEWLWRSLSYWKLQSMRVK